MKKLPVLCLVVALLIETAALRAEETTPKMPEMPAPVKQHEWLQQFVGEWETEAELIMEPGKPPIKGKGTESDRQLGGFWVVGHGTGEMEGMPGPMHSVLTIGYDPAKGKYIGTWIDSMTSHLWTYEGSVDATGKILTLEAEGPCPFKAGMAKFRDVTEFKANGERVLTSSMQGDDGKWVTMLTARYTRKK